MIAARRLWLTVVASLCGLACAFAGGAAPAMAGTTPTQFGSPGEGSGQFGLPYGIGVDQETGDVYVADKFFSRINKFDDLGNFLMAWGWDVNEMAPAEENQICTTLCQLGVHGSGTGQYASEGPYGLAVDNDPVSSHGDVYVVDWENYRVEKFDSSGSFILMFGGGVNRKTGGNVCLAGEECGAGTSGSADGQFEWSSEGEYIAVGPGGAVYVGDRARVEVFEPSGVWRENISLSSLSGTGQVTALAVDAAGDVYAKDSGVPGVREFEPGGIEKATPFDAGSESVQAIALDGSGDLLVDDSSGGFHVLEYNPSGAELESFGLHTAPHARGIAFSEALGGELYVSNRIETESSVESNVWILPLPAPGPLVELGSESAKPGERGTATLEAVANPEGSETKYHFEYVSEAQFKTSEYAGASSTPPVAIGSSFEGQAASVGLIGLIPGGTYHYRVVATNSNGTARGPDHVLTTVPPALVEGPWAANVASTSATLAANIDPLGVSTAYRLEYGPSAVYGNVVTGSAGNGTGYVAIGSHLQGLLPDTTYHYRLVTINEVGTVEGSDHTFTTQLVGGSELTLPDGRAWELVSPPDKGGAAIELFHHEEFIQAASDGSAIAYYANQPIGENSKGYVLEAQILSMRVPGGWRTEDIDAPIRLPEGESAVALYSKSPEGWLFSPDLSSALFTGGDPSTFTPLSPEATETTPYVRNDVSGSYLPLLTTADVTPGTKFAAQEHRILASTPDLSHVVLASGLALTPEAVDIPEETGPKPYNLYEWSAGRLQLVNILPTKEPTGDEGASLGSEEGNAGGMRAHAISSDGRWIVWYVGHLGQRKSLYVRDMVEKKTLRIGGVHASFQSMSSDGSRIFYVENGELYEFDTGTDTQTDLTADHGASEHDGGVKEAVLGISEDGCNVGAAGECNVYFVASGVLASGSGAVSGGDNLYVSHDTAGGWSTTYIATLSGEDEHSWWAAGYGHALDLSEVSSRVSPDGRFLTFMSDRPLTGYDNVDAVSGKPDEEVYLYDAVSGHLVCASCDPTGARPVGVFESGMEEGRMLTYQQTPWEGHWLAGSVPGWRGHDNKQLYQPRYLSDSGRLFFESPDALVPHDTNGLEDVYEYEPADVGSCESGSATFSERSGGCVSLISSGTSRSESAFLDASENGNDVFFLTASRLSPADYDTSLDVYDAHACSAAAPCVAAPVLPPPCDSGDSCKAAPSQQPEVFGAPASATFSGAGNVAAEPPPTVGNGKTKQKRHVKRHKQKKRGRKRAKKASTGRLSGKGDR